MNPGTTWLPTLPEYIAAVLWCVILYWISGAWSSTWRGWSRGIGVMLALSLLFGKVFFALWSWYGPLSIALFMTAAWLSRNMTLWRRSFARGFSLAFLFTPGPPALGLSPLVLLPGFFIAESNSLGQFLGTMALVLAVITVIGLAASICLALYEIATSKPQEHSSSIRFE